MAKSRRERLAVDELHRQNAIAVVLADVEDARNVGVCNASRELHLSPEPLECAGSAYHIGAQHLEGDELVELEIPGLVHVAHAARAEQAQDLVPGADHPALDRGPGRLAIVALLASLRPLRAR